MRALDHAIETIYAKRHNPLSDALGAGRPKESDTALKQLIKIRPSGWAYQIAEVYAYRGEVDKAFDWMDRAYQQRDRGLLVVKSDWLVKNLRQDPRYTELLKMHLSR
jgi:hypothetical protein